MADKNIICSAYFPKTDTHALVQEENDCVYLYMYIRPDQDDQEIRASWVRNYGKAIDAVDKKAMDNGLQPRMPMKACAHPAGAPVFNPADLRIVFMEDGDGAALYEKDALLAVIPGWASSGEFTGYARDAVGTSPFAWELGTPADNDIYGRVGKADAYWQSMQDGKTWEAFRDSHLASIEKAYGPHSEYLVVDSGYFPPKALVRVDKGGDTYIFTLGMSLLCQPSVEMFSQYPEGLRRAELAMGVKKDIFDLHRDQFIAYLAGLSDIPWNYTTFLADGHTVLFDINGKFKNRFSNALLLEGENSFGERLYGDFRGDTVNLLWVVPINGIHQKYAEEKGNDGLMKLAKNIKSSGFRVFDGEEKFVSVKNETGAGKRTR